MRGLGLLAVLAAFLASGCGIHLGDGFGRRTRATLDAQANSKSEGVPISGDDAKYVMSQHQGKAGNSGSSSGAGFTSGSFGSSSSGSQSQPIILTPSASKPISLDAVR